MKRNAWAFALFLLPVLAFVGMAGPASWGQDLEECLSPGIEFSDEEAATSEIDVAEDLEIDVLKVRTDVTHGFINDVTIEVTSPEGTTLALFDRFGLSVADIVVVWSDDGVAHGFDDEFACDCEMRPSTGEMANFRGESTEGVWTLDVSDAVAGDDGVLDQWCVIVDEPCVVLAPASLTCELVDDTDVDLEWTNEETYDSITVIRNGEVIADLEGDDTTYTDEGVPGGVLDYVINGFVDDDDCGNDSERCQILQGLQQVCLESTAEISDAEPPVLLFISVAEDNEPQEIEVEVDITHPELSDLEISITHSGVTVQLHDLGGEGQADMLVVFNDNGVPNGDEPFDCACRMAPSGPGSLADFIDEPADGLWLVSVDDEVLADDGTLNGVCLRLFDESQVDETLFIRGDADGNGTYTPLLDALYMLSDQFQDGPSPPCAEAADCDNNGVYGPLLDALYILTDQFQDGPSPEAPHPDCGPIDVDDTEDLGCETPPETC